MRKRILRKLLRLDEYVAAELLEFNTFGGQRSRDDNWVKQLAKYIEDGDFLTGSVAIVILKYDDNRRVMVNGQHQCKALICVGGTIDVVYEEWECDSATELSELFSFYDNHRARSLSHILNPEAHALGITWKRAVVRLVVSAAALNIDGYPIKTISKIEKKNLLRQRLSEGAFVNHILKDGISCQHIARAPVVRAMFDTWAKNKTAADKFWIMVRDGEKLSKEEPAMVLRGYLFTTGLTKARTQKSSTSTVREMYVKCIHAWNAWVEGRKTNLKYVSDATLPKIKTP